LADDLTEAWYNLGLVQRRLRENDAAVASFQKAVSAKRPFTRAYDPLGMLLYRLERFDEARRLYQEWLAQEPGHPTARHMAAAMSGEGAEPRASDEYVKKLFDGFASFFDSTLEALSYRAPQLLVSALGEFTGMHSADLDVLDAGCGTGLCGPLLRSSARKLHGVDLSDAMVAKAKERNIYDELSVGELCAYMNSNSVSYDVVISADTLCYFGDLQEPLEAARECLRPGGLIAFTVEEYLKTESPKNYSLEPHGRYSHGMSYLDEVVRRAGFQVQTRESVTLRKERHEDVRGFSCIARRPP
jgi:predicted TPR repeat methyltransferase